MNVFVTGGAGYVGAKLIPALLKDGYKVKVFDLFLYGEDVFDEIRGNKGLELVKGDIRDQKLLDQHLKKTDIVIHLACISNDPSFELNPNLGKSINFDAFRPLVELSIKNGVKKFIYASSSSVYGVKDVSEVTEEMSLEPLTDYSKFKADCEKVLAEYQSDKFTTCTIRPATVCGYSPRQRLDVIVNIMSNLAYNTGVVKVFGGKQMRPNIHIDDMVRVYLHVLKQPNEKIAGKIFNAGQENYTVEEIAQMVTDVLQKDKSGKPIVKEVVPTNDNRSYHISSKKITRELGFVPQFTIMDAVRDLKGAFTSGKLQDPLNNIRYFNIKMMQAVGLK